MNNNTELVKPEKGRASSYNNNNGFINPSNGLGVNRNSALNSQLNTFQAVKPGSSGNQNLAKAIVNETEKSKTDSTNTKDASSLAMSDERCKELFGSTNLIDAIAEIDAYKYKYKDSVQNDPRFKDAGVDDKTHYGPMAQDLENNPVTNATVITDQATGAKMVDTKKLSLTEFAIITELANRLINLENIVEKLVNDRS